MKNLFNQDFKELIQLLNKHSVEYILVGGYAVILHGYIRTTGDLDIWLNRTEENYAQFSLAGNEFGLPMQHIDRETFLYDKETDVFSFGRPPSGLDIMLDVKGLVFDEVFDQCEMRQVDDLEVRLIHINSLKIAKKAAGRPRDISDLEHLEQE